MTFEDSVILITSLVSTMAILGALLGLWLAIFKR